MNTIKQKKTITITGDTTTARFSKRFDVNFIPSIVHLRAISMYCKGNKNSPAAELVYVIKCNGMLVDENVLYHFVMNTQYQDGAAQPDYVGQAFHATPNIPFKCSGNLNGNSIEFMITNPVGDLIDMDLITGGIAYAMSFTFEE